MFSLRMYVLFSFILFFFYFLCQITRHEPFAPSQNLYLSKNVEIWWWWEAIHKRIAHLWQDIFLYVFWHLTPCSTRKFISSYLGKLPFFPISEKQHKITSIMFSLKDTFWAKNGFLLKKNVTVVCIAVNQWLNFIAVTIRTSGKYTKSTTKHYKNK